MDLKRIKDLPEGFPVKLQTLYTWHHLGKYPNLLVKFGGALCIDLDEIGSVLKGKSIPLRKAEERQRLTQGA